MSLLKLALGVAGLATVATVIHAAEPKPDNSITIALEDPIEVEREAPVHHTWKSKLTPEQQEEWLLAAAMWMECRGQGNECMRAIGHVILNRAKADKGIRWGHGITGVIYHKKQYSGWYDQNREDLRNLFKQSEHSPDRIAWTIARGEAKILLHEKDPDPVHGATMYHAPYVKPAWIKDMKFVRQYAGHLFYKPKADMRHS